MIITDRAEIERYADKLFLEQRRHVYVLDAKGALQVDGTVNSYVYLIYLNGQWYGARNKRFGSSERIPESGKNLFVMTENKFFAVKEDGSVEYSSEKKDLSADYHSFALIYQAEGLVFYLADGSKKRCPMMTLLEATPENIELMAEVIIALTHRYDPKAAEEMEKFFYNKEEKAYPPKIEW